MGETLRKAQSDINCTNIVTASVSVAVSSVGMRECKSTPTLLCKRRGKDLRLFARLRVTKPVILNEVKNLTESIEV
ncbi:hypothetical protein OF66_2526 [Seleniivibrio woodruffii]|uniref:Uncharacterized protein n=2 Tax=Seleniivibrio woodruffii TaxID=1078050 RepID=A0A4R1KH39_9BACT|nr:hypothetical protein C8D98_1224 [Seleniivibrio woodruffii]TVZ36886.1 hypothetical protein OF66_2526 [Seleniivibrio woodruffii]